MTFLAIFSEKIITKGVRSIETIETDKKYWLVSASKRLFSIPTLDSIKANSPTWNRESPVRITVFLEYLSTATAMPAAMVLIMNTASTKRLMVQIFSKKKLKSNNIPIDTKKKLINNSLNGSITLVA